MVRSNDGQISSSSCEIDRKHRHWQKYIWYMNSFMLLVFSIGILRAEQYKPGVCRVISDHLVALLLLQLFTIIIFIAVWYIIILTFKEGFATEKYSTLLTFSSSFHGHTLQKKRQLICVQSTFINKYFAGWMFFSNIQIPS